MGHGVQDSCFLCSVIFPFCCVSWLGKVEWGKGYLEITGGNFAFCLFKVFEIMEEAKVLFNLEDYSVKQVTLEQIFLTFANTDKMRGFSEIIF